VQEVLADVHRADEAGSAEEFGPVGSKMTMEKKKKKPTVKETVKEKRKNL
jgi:hypothetical protein